MTWSQDYHPLGSWLSVVLAAAPLVVLLGCIGIFHVRAHVAALLGLAAALADCGPRLRHAGRPRRARGGLWRGLRPVADRLDRAQHHLPLPAHQRAGAVPGLARFDRDGNRGQPAPAPADRLLPGRLLRGRGGLRHPRRGDGRDADRARLHPAPGIGPVADRQHGAGRIRRARHAARHARRPSPACRSRICRRWSGGRCCLSA